MTQLPFLDILAHTLLERFSGGLSRAIVVLPNRRAKVFLLEALRRNLGKNAFAPQITTIEDFIQDVAGLRAIDNIELLFAFYEAYIGVTPQEKRQSFSNFANWAPTLLQDFNEIDRYLIEPHHVLSYLKDIEDIKRWGLEPEQKTPLLENYIGFWQQLPTYYDALYQRLLRSGKGYQGLIYREAVSNAIHFAEAIKNQHYVFAGFNALSAAEEKIIQHLAATGHATIFWDADKSFLNDEMHDAGLFLRRFKAHWPTFRGNPFNWVFDAFEQPKHIKIIGTPKSVGQAKIAAKIIEDEVIGRRDINKTAVILGEENLLLPLLRELPADVPSLNITMGYSARNNPAQLLVAKLFRMHSSALSRDAAQYVFYYKDVLDILTHPLVAPFAKADLLVQTIKQQNYTFLTLKKLFELHAAPNSFFALLFSKWDVKPEQILQTIAGVLLAVKNQLGNEDREQRLVKAFVYAVFKVVNKLISYCTANEHISGVDTLHALYKQAIELAEVSFEGEPLSGLQIMGVLESRVLDFETVIITSMNEGKFPAGKSSSSFIPYDVKMELGLPTYKEKDAIYTYHFYHLLQRAKNVYLIYNTESEGIDGGERSRFIAQLQIERKPAHEITAEIRQAKVPPVAYQPVVIPKSAMAMQRLQEIADEGFSPSALTSYIRDPLLFYRQKLLRIRDAEEVEENVALNTLGTIIHEALRVLYEPFVGKILTAADIRLAMSRIDAEVLNQFKIVYKAGEIKKGKNLLAFEVAKRNVFNFLKVELADVENGDEVQILALEQTFEKIFEHPSLPRSVKIRGNVDRIEMRNGTVRIIDYKTGKVEARDMVLKTWDGLVGDIKNDKIIQVLAYAFLFENEIGKRKTEVGIISFKNMKNGFLPFTAKGEGTILTNQILDNYKDQLAQLVSEILDPETPFAESTV
jgi:hypothetical protein